jgi:Protein of Unknown function (DUF2784)
MVYQSLADLVLLLHIVFIVFVPLGGLFAFRWHWVPMVHLPAAAWGVAVELFGWVCPLTPLESALRRTGGGTGYSAGFIEQYIVPLVYPTELTRNLQLVLGAIVVVVNVVVYVLILRRQRRRTDR